MSNNNRSSLGLGMKRKRSNSAISVTEGNVATEILSRLPARSLVRFKSVCKSWHALISDPYFLKKQSDRAKKKPQLLIMPFSCTGGLREVGFYAYVPASRLQAHLMSETKLPEVQKALTRPQHVDGFLLLNTVTGLHVCNPTTGEFITLPEGNSHVPTHRREYNSRAGFGYVARDKCYKVARYFYRWHDWSSKTYSLGLEVFELGRSGSSWRVVDEDPTHPIHTFSTPVSIRGVVYFKIDNRLHTSPPKGVLAFDLTHEKFKEIDRPSSFSAYKYNENGEVRILELEGELCFVGASCRSSRLDIWAYSKEEEGDVFSWVHTYSMVLPYSGTYAVPVGVSEGKLLLHLYYVSSGMHFLEFYDPPTGSFDTVVATLKDMAYFKPPDRYCVFGEKEILFQVIKYVESLASITTRRLTSP